MLLRATLMACMIMAITGGTVLADCPTPSFVAVTKRSCPTCGVQAAIESKIPVSTIVINSAAPDNERALFHGGDVLPRSIAFFFYIDVATGNEFRSWATLFSRPNGVIHHEPERMVLTANPGTVLEVVARWLDECGAGIQERTIGFVEMQ